MDTLLFALAAISALELMIWLPGGWTLRRVIAVVVAILLALLSTALFVRHPRLWTGVVALFGFYRCFNILRIVKGRMHEKYLRWVALRSSLWLMAWQLLALASLKLPITMHVDTASRWTVVAVLQLALGAVLLSSTLRHLRTTREKLPSKAFADRDLPTLSVLVPARNETDELEACLRSLVADDYPKLEILVLDDCSQNAKTPEIIRSFAHEGVRFVVGQEPGPTWLAKNLGYEKLTEEANGELLLFCGVDTHFAPGGLRQLVAMMLQKQKSMVSIMPVNDWQGAGSLFVQPMRYAWELSLPRRLFQRPPVLSTCWLIKKSLLVSAGGFKAVSRTIVPESYFARTAAVTDGYSFLRSGIVTSRKPLAEQRATAIRTRYPQLHRRPEWVALLAVTELLALVSPYVLCATMAVQHFWVPAVLSGVACICTSLFYALVVGQTYHRFHWTALAAAPLAGVYDVGLLQYSMVKYEFSEVLWKGRNVCIPVMHVVPHLPNAS